MSGELEYFERLDEQRWQMSGLAVFGRSNGSMPLWNSRYSFSWSAGRFFWRWRVWENGGSNRVIATGRSLTLRGAVWAAEMVAGA